MSILAVHKKTRKAQAKKTQEAACKQAWRRGWDCCESPPRLLPSLRSGLALRSALLRAYPRRYATNPAGSYPVCAKKTANRGLDSWTAES